jgi:hypothetical protein
MTNRKSPAPAPRSRSAPQVVSPRNKTNVALPFSRFTVEEPVKMTVGDWISLAGLVVSVIGFSVVIWQHIGSRIHRKETRQAIERDEQAAG